MQINSVSSVQAFTAQNPVLPLVALAGADDRTIKSVAYTKTLSDVNDSKHRKLHSALVAALPLSVGLDAAITPKNMSRLGRLSQGTRAVASLSALIATVGAAFAAKDVFEDNNKLVSKFNSNHPLLSNLATLFAGWIGYDVLSGGFEALYAKYGQPVNDKLKPVAEKLANKLNTNKILNSLSKGLAEAPSAAKEIAKIGVKAAPWLIFATAIAHDLRHESEKTRVYYDNCMQLKDAQSKARVVLSNFV